MRILFALALLLSVLTASDARARGAHELRTEWTADKLARDHFQKGLDLYLSANYEHARLEFELAWKLCGAADLLHNISAALEHMGKIEESIEYAKRFLEATEGRLSPEEVSPLRERMARLESLLPQHKDNRSTNSKFIAPIVLLGTGALILSIGAACGIAALVTAADLRNNSYFLGEYQALASRGRALNAAAIVLDVGGVALMLGGGIWFFHSRRHR